MKEDERRALFSVFIYGCPGELPKNMHINLNLLARITGFSPSKLVRIFSDISCLQFESHLREDDENEEGLGRKEMLVVSWNNFNEYFEDGNATIAINTICELVEQSYCKEHLIEALCKLDFSSLSDVTAEELCHH